MMAKTKARSRKATRKTALTQARLNAIETRLRAVMPEADAQALKHFLVGALGKVTDTGLPIAAKRAAEKLTSRSLYESEAMVDPSRLFASGLFSQYNPSVLVTRQGLAIFDEMMMDEQVKMAMSFKVLATLAPGWEVRSPGDEEDDWEVTQFVRDSFTNFDGGWHQALKKIMRALRYGFSICEKIYAKPKDAPPWAEGKATLRKLNEIKPHYLDFDMNAFGDVLAVIQRWTPGTSSSIPEKLFSLEKFVHYAFDREHENPYGKSDLEAAYRPWWAKDNAYKWLTVMLERYGMPPLFLFYNPDEYLPNQVESLKRIMRNIQNATNGILPRASEESLEFWTQQIGQGSKDIFLGALGRFDVDIAKAILMPSHIGATSETKDQGSGGSMARSNVHFKMFMFVILELQKDLAQVVNSQIIKQLCDLNFPNLKSYPEMVLNGVDDEIETKIFELWDKLVTGKVVGRIEDDETYIRSALGMPKNENVVLEDLPGDAALKSKEKLAKEGIVFGGDDEPNKKGKNPFGGKEKKPGGASEMPFEEQSPEMRTFAEEHEGVWVRLENGHSICVKRHAWDGSKQYAEEGGVWRTIRGRRVFIRDGESVDDALARSLKPKADSVFIRVGESVEDGEFDWEVTATYPIGPDVSMSDYGKDGKKGLIEARGELAKQLGIDVSAIGERGRFGGTTPKWEVTLDSGIAKTPAEAKAAGEKAKAKHKDYAELEAQYAFNPNQPRDPKGSATGGQWTGASDAEVDEAKKKLKAMPKDKTGYLHLEDVFGKKRVDMDGKKAEFWYDHLEVASPFGPFAAGKGLWKEREVKIADLVFAETDVGRREVFRMLDERKDIAAAAKSSGEFAYAIKDSRHGLILMDGHHRMMAAHLLGRKTMTLRVVDGMKYKKLIQELM
jgi:hypothetical protein